MVKTLLFVTLLFVSACSLKQREEQSQIKHLYEKGLFDKALSVLEKSSLKAEEENKLLYLLQKAKLLFAKEHYFEALANFQEAQDLMDKLYTKKVREILLSGVLNENSKSYRGQIYERSLLYYYQALGHLKIYQSGKYIRTKTKKNEKNEKEYQLEEVVLNPEQRKQELFKARAAVLAWDSFYTDIQRSKFKSTFKHDLFAKILAAEIHKLIDKRTDGQIALQLFKDGLNILERIGPSFEIFNEASEQYHQIFWDNGKENPKLKKLTTTYNKTYKYIVENIALLTKQYRSYEFNKIIKKYKLNKQDISNKQKRNKRFLIEFNTVSPLVGKEFSYNLRSAIDEVESPTARAFIKGVGVPILTYFAMGPLGLGGVSTTGNTRVFVRHSVGEVMTQEAGIEFEMPVVQKQKFNIVGELVIFKKKKDLKLLEENIFKTVPLELIGPISDMAYAMNKEVISNSFAKFGSRIAIKHVIAIIAAYKTYERIKESGGELLAKPAAFAQYLASSKVIKESERADTRQWTTLPSEVQIAETDLEDGEYVLGVYSNSGEQKLIRKLGEVTITNQNQEMFSFISK